MLQRLERTDIMVNWLILLTLICLDLVSKHIAFTLLALGQKINLFSILSLCLAKNYGLGFGLGQGFTKLITIFNVLILNIFIWMFHQSDHKSSNKTILLLILAGGLGNLFDRMVLGFVRDFMLISWHEWSWPIFNLADVYITLAFLLVLFQRPSCELPAMNKRASN